MAPLDTRHLFETLSDARKNSKPDFENPKDSFVALVDMLHKETSNNPSSFIQAIRTLPKEKKLKRFLDWLSENNCSNPKVSVKFGFKEGGGLVANEGIKEGENIIQIPKQLSISAESVLKGEIKESVQKGTKSLVDEARANPTTSMLFGSSKSLPLVLFLIQEIAYRSSFWSPYLENLPTEYSIPLFWSSKELSLLQYTSCFEETQKLIINTAMTFVMLKLNLFSTSSSSTTVLPSSKFTWPLFAWAMAAVLTRQNAIPTSDGSSLSLALIPFWDMANHSSDLQQISTFFESEKNSTCCYAKRDYSKGEQVYIFYGSRSNADLLNYSGFALLENSFHKLSLPLQTALASDPLAAVKLRLLEKNDLGNVVIMSGREEEFQVAMTQARVCAVSKETLGEVNKAFQGENAEIGLENEESALRFLRSCLELVSVAVKEKALESLNQRSTLTWNESNAKTLLQSDLQALGNFQALIKAGEQRLKKRIRNRKKKNRKKAAQQTGQQ